MYTNDPLNNPVDAVRLEVGDTDEFEIWLTDNDYLYYLTQYDGNIRKCTTAAASAILFKLARRTRERAGQIDVYGAEAYRNYADALDRKLKDFNLNNVNPISYFGGINRELTSDNFQNPNLIDQPFYRGQQNGKPDWYGKREVLLEGDVEEPLEWQDVP